MPELMITRDLLKKGIQSTFKMATLRKGFCINVREMSLKESIQFVELRDQEDSSELDKLNLLVDIALRVCVDESGKRLFQDDDRELLQDSFTGSELASVVVVASGVDTESVPEKPESSNKATDSG